MGMKAKIELYDDKIIVEHPHQGNLSAYLANPEKIASLAVEACMDTGKTLAQWAFDNNEYQAPPDVIEDKDGDFTAE
jgi:hypothetical protein